ncbi:MAG: sulfatase-like hydrolase/transferase [bacterium]|nr:sulfatase-like hydrolase/transferase [bacterium]
MKTKKKIILLIVPLVVIITVIAVVLLSHLKEKKGPLDMNLLLITLDTTRADHIGAYAGTGANTAATPHIDKMAAQGVLFKNCYTPVPLTLPAHCSIFTGKYPIGHNVRNNGRYALHEDEPTITKLFKKKGYFNYAVISAYVLLSKFGLNRGFDIYDDSLDPKKVFIDFNSQLPADGVYEKFRQWFEDNNEKKFFAWVHFFDPHTPYNPPQGLKTGKDDTVNRYNGEISYMDSYIGKIIADLEAAEVLDNTLVIIVGDHGEAFGEHVEYEHGIFCYEEALKVPLIFFNRTVFKENSVVDNRVGLVDIFPTIAELYGEKIPENDGVQGKSFVNLLYGGKEEEERPIYFESMYGKEENNWAPLTGIIDGQFKYIALPHPELYHLTDDTAEKINLYRRPPRVSRVYDQKLQQFLLKNSSLNKETKRDLSKRDIAHLKSLGYISQSSGKSASVIDPKTGVALDIKLKDLQKKVSRGLLEESETGLKKLLEENPNLKHPMIYVLLDKIYVGKKDFDASVKNLQEGIRVFPNSEELNFRLLGRFYTSKQYDEAVTFCKSLLKKNPFFTQAYAILGDIYLIQGKYLEAIENAKKAAELEPENIRLNLKYADILVKLQKITEALELYEKLSKKEKLADDHGFFFWYAKYSFTYGSIKRAEELMRRAVRLKPNGNYHFYFALILSKNFKYKEAVESMRTALEKYPQQLTDRQKKDAGAAINAWKQKAGS